MNPLPYFSEVAMKTGYLKLPLFILQRAVRGPLEECFETASRIDLRRARGEI